MKAARSVGAIVVFISQHAKKRAKGLKLNRAGLIDTHWVALLWDGGCRPDHLVALAPRLPARSDEIGTHARGGIGVGVPFQSLVGEPEASGSLGAFPASTR